MEIAGKSFLVTGGASGLGAATVAALRARGAHVVVLDLQPAPGAAVQGSVTEPDDVLRAVALATAGGRPLYGVVQCAGLAHAERVVGSSGPHALESFECVVRVNLVGAFNVARLTAEAMQANPADENGERGVIVLTSSIAAYEGQHGQVAYSAAKAGIAGMTLPMAREFARYGVRVMCVAPGLFDTPLLAALPPKVKQELGQAAPFPNRLGKPEEFAQLVLSIVGNPMLNGEVIRLDGALRMPPR
jgi:NAD(P)-dependent dehydrogenase (short-subunit alcohol dehydrogenase family)